MDVPAVSLSILHIDPDEAFSCIVQKNIENGARSRGIDTFIFHSATTVPEAEEMMRTGSYDCIISCNELAGGTGLGILSDMRDCGIDTPFIMIVSACDAALARDVFVHGADDLFIRDDIFCASGRIYSSITGAVAKASERRLKMAAEQRKSWEDDFLARIAIELSWAGPEKNIFGVLSGHLREILGDNISIVAMHSPVDRIMGVRKIIASDDCVEGIKDGLEKYMVGMEVSLPQDVISELEKGRPVPFDGPLSSVFDKWQQSVPPYDLETSLSIVTKTLIPVLLRRDLVGCILVMARDGASPVSISFILRYLNQVTIAVERWYIERESQRKGRQYHSYFSESPTGIAVTGKDGVICDVNASFLSMLGISKEEATGTDIFSFFTPCSDCAADIKDKWAAPGDENKCIDICYTGKDGTPSFMSFRHTFTPDGKIVAFFNDITERKKAMKRADKLNTFLAAMRMVNKYIYLRPDRHSLLVNVCNLFTSRVGYPAAWAVCCSEGRITETVQVGIDDGRLFHSLRGTYTRIPCVAASIGAPSEIYVADKEHDCRRCPMHSHHAGSVSMAVALNYRKRTFGVLGFQVPVGQSEDAGVRDLFKKTADDIAYALYSMEREQERLAIENRAKKHQRDYKKIFDTAASTIVSVDSKGVIVDCNGIVENLLGYGRDEVIGSPIHTFFHPDYIQKARDSLATIVASSTTAHNEYVLVTKGGNKRYVSINSSPLFDDDGTFERTISFVTDLTYRKRIEDDILSQREELSKFAHMLSHDIRGGLSVIQGYAELLREDGCGEFSEKVIEKSKDISAFISRSVALADAGKILGTTGRVNIKSVIEEVAAETFGKNMSFSCDDIPPVDADIFRCREVFENLFRNIVIHSEASAVRVEDRSDMSRVRIYIHDNGIGISPDVMKDIFKWGYSTRSKGTGFGLAIVKKILNAHGGAVAVQSVPGKGTTFIVSAPPAKD